MGVSTDAILAYGYDLGGGDEWQVRELDEYGGLIPGTGGWVPDPEVEEDYDLTGLAERHLLDASGFTETYEDGREGYFGRENEAREALGVEFETYCSDECPMYLLAAKVHTVAWGYVGDAGAFIAAADDATRQEWDAKLASAVAALGLTPLQEKPKWLLVSYRG
jgi:hypothetical protein